MPNSSQLDDAAASIGYRCGQLTGVAVMISYPYGVASDAPGVNPRAVGQSALVESALTNARCLAYFLAGRKGEAFAGDYLALSGSTEIVEPTLADVASAVLGPVSNHLSHAKYAKRLSAANLDPEAIELAWPIRELALVLVGGVADVVTQLDDRVRELFGDPSPVRWAATLDGERARFLAQSSAVTLVKLDPEVRALTDGLRGYLGWV